MRVLIIGAARQGTSLASYLARQGACVVLNDRRPAGELLTVQQSLTEAARGAAGRIEFTFGGHPVELLHNVDLVCPSGGVPLNLPLLAEARNRGIKFSNDSQIFVEAAPCPVVGITGSAGKTTTTTLVGRMAQAAAAGSNPPKRAYVGGNIGVPLISDVDQMHADDVAVIELSSFQLEIMTLSPHVAAILNITPNHLDRHASMADYTQAKARILEFQSEKDIAVLGREDPGAWNLTPVVRGELYSFGFGEPPAGTWGTFVKDENIFLRKEGGDTFLMPCAAVLLRGKHNMMNVLAACAIAAAAGFPVSAMRAGVEGFRGVPHRLEFVRHWGGASWFNDSIATAPERSMAAIRSFDEPLILLAGGRDKNLPWDEFASLIRQRVDYLVLFGEAAEKIENALNNTRPGQSVRPYRVERSQGLKEAVNIATQLVKPGYIVLLSPGGTSFDEFRDFEDRGEVFRQWVMELP